MRALCIFLTTDRAHFDCSKIKRIILESTTKFDGKREVRISSSQIKQIAGRAGRYGLHGDSDAGGVATTLHDADLPILRAAMDAPLQPIACAQLQLDRVNSEKLVKVLPVGVTVAAILDVFKYVARVRAPYALTVHYKDAHIRLVYQKELAKALQAMSEAMFVVGAEVLVATSF